jgi:hypothetical protein
MVRRIMHRAVALVGAFVFVTLVSTSVHAEPSRDYEGEQAVVSSSEAEVEWVQTQTEAVPLEDEPTAPAVGPIEPGDSIEAPAPGSYRVRNSLVYRNLFAARYNPLGLVNEFLLGYRVQLIDKPGPLFRDSFAAVHLHTFLNPAFGRVGPMVEVQPLAILNLQATYNYVGYFTTFDQLMSFDSPAANYSDTELSRRGDEGENYRTKGHLVTLSALLQAKVGRIAIRDNLKAYWADIDLRDGDTVFYDQTLDILEPNRGWVLNNDADLLYLFDFGLKLGARYTLTHAFYREDHFPTGQPVVRGVNSPMHRIGPAFLYTFYDKPERRFNKPTIIVLLQWWARHRWRTGEDVHPAVPYLVVGFLFEGRLLPDPRRPGERGRRKGKKASRAR